MGCGCKSDTISDNLVVSDKKMRGDDSNIIKYIIKFIGFLIGLMLLPIIMLAVIWFMFDVIVLNKKVDFVQSINKWKKLYNKKDKNNEDDYYDDEDDDDDEYLMLNVEDITNK